VTVAARSGPHHAERLPVPRRHRRPRACPRPTRRRSTSTAETRAPAGGACGTTHRLRRGPSACGGVRREHPAAAPVSGRL